MTEPILRDGCWFLEVEVIIADVLEGKPWLLSKTCADILKKDHGVDLVFKEDVEVKEKMFPSADCMRLELRVDKNMAESRKAQDAKWCLSMAYDRLRFWAAKGPCCWRVFYDGPDPDTELSSKALVRQVVGEERARLDDIETDTCVMVRLVPIKFEGAGEEKQNGALPPPRLLVKLRGVEWKAVQEAERRVTLLLEERGGWRGTGDGGGAGVGDGAIDLSRKVPPVTHTKQQNGQEEKRDPSSLKTLPGATPVVDRGNGRKQLMSSGTESKALTQQVHKPKRETEEVAIKEEELGSQVQVFRVPGCSRLLHVYDIKARGYARESEIRVLIESVLEEMVEVGEGLLGANERMVTRVTLLDSHLAEVEMGHEELAAACLELLKRDPTTFKRLVVESGPEERWGPVPNSPEPKTSAGVVTVSNTPKGSTPRSVYNTIHKAVQGVVSAGERERARKLSGGKLISAIRSSGSEGRGTLLVYFPTCELADKTIAAYEQDPKQFRGLILRPQKGSSKPQNHVDLRPSRKFEVSTVPRPLLRSTNVDSLQARSVPAGAFHGPTKSSPAYTDPKAGSGWDVRPTSNPETAVFVNRIPQHSSRSEVVSTFSRVLNDNCSRAELASAEGGQVVVEIRMLTPHCAALYLGSKSLTARAVELYKQDMRVFEGMVVKPYENSESPRAKQLLSPREREGQSNSLRTRGRGEEAEVGEGRRLTGTTVRSGVRGFDRGRVGYGGDAEEGIEYERGGHGGGEDGRRGDGYTSPLSKRQRLFSPDNNANANSYGGRGALRGDVLLSSRQQKATRGEKERARLARVEADGFVRLNKERCVYFQKIPAHLAEPAALEEVVTEWFDALGGPKSAPNGECVTFVKLLKSGDAFVEFENRECVERLLRAPTWERRRFEGMVLKAAVWNV